MGDVVKIKGFDRRAEITLNGARMETPVTAYHLRQEVGGLPVLELEMVAPIDFEGEARVEIPPALRTALIALGWTAPA